MTERLEVGSSALERLRGAPRSPAAEAGAELLQDLTARGLPGWDTFSGSGVDLRAEWAKWIGSKLPEPWVFLTGTFALSSGTGSWTAPGVSYARRAANSTIRRLCNRLVGGSAIAVVEGESSLKRHHVHAIYSGDRGAADVVQEWEGWWRARYGFATVREVRSAGGAALYVAKYLVKAPEGDVVPYFVAGGRAWRRLT